MIKWVLNNWTVVVIGLLVAGLIGLNVYNGILADRLALTQVELGIANNNVLAYKASTTTWTDRYGQEHAKNIMFVTSLTDFKKGGDSIQNELVDIIKQQGTQLNKLQAAALIQTKVTTSLTKEISTKLPDTVIDLSNANIRNVLTFTPYSIKSDIELWNKQTILATDSTYKIYLPRRYKFFIRRWLQEKQKETLVNMEVINSNPLIKTTQQRFFHIIKEK